MTSKRNTVRDNIFDKKNTLTKSLTEKSVTLPKSLGGVLHRSLPQGITSPRPRGWNEVGLVERT